MTQSMLQTLLETLTSPQVIGVASCCGALLAARCGCGCGHDNDDDGEEDDGELAPGFSFSKQDLEEYRETVEQTNKRITEISDALDSGDDSNAKELTAELIACYFCRAARLQEEGEVEAAIDDYAAAFARYAEYVENFGESLELLKFVAAARLNHGILLYDSGELEDADEEYVRAEEATQKLADFGDREAKLDLAGIRLNRASILFERGDHDAGLRALDDEAEEFRKIAEDPENKSSEALYYLAKTYATKSTFLRSLLEEDDVDSPQAREATETLKRGIDVYRNLVDGGNVQYRRDLADALVLHATTLPTHEKSDLEFAAETLSEACVAYQKAIACGEQDACVDLFDAALQRAEILLKLERFTKAEELYDTILDTFESFAKSDELPLLEGLAVAYQNRAKLRKGKAKPSAIIEDLTHAIELQSAITESIINSLKDDEHDHEGCCCGGRHGAEHDHEGCCCGGRHGAEHDHEGCCCGGRHGDEHDHEGCCCGGGAERAFLIDRWANDNFRALMECFYERINAHLENHDSAKAAADCVAAEELSKAYRSVLKEGETLDDEVLKEILVLKQAF